MYPLAELTVEQYADVFEEPKGLMPERKLEHTIELTPGSKPLPLKCYRYSNKEKLKRLLEAYVNKGWNRNSKSLYGLPVS